MEWKRSDVRTDYAREGVRQWRGIGKHVHLPTGFVEEFGVSFIDREDMNRALVELRRRVESHALPEPPISAET